MNRIIIACATLKRELKWAMAQCHCTDPVIWLTPGAHNLPEKRRDEIRQTLEKCAGYDTILLCMTFCGNSLVGLESGEHTLVLPRMDDCLGLLRGTEIRPNDTYYLSEGWLQGRENILNEYDAAVKKHGTSRADRVFSAMLRNYRRLVWLGSSPAPDRVRSFAERFGLELSVEDQDLSKLVKLLEGNWTGEFLVVPPNTHITAQMRKGG